MAIGSIPNAPQEFLRAETCMFGACLREIVEVAFTILPQKGAGEHLRGITGAGGEGKGPAARR